MLLKIDKLKMIVPDKPKQEVSVILFEGKRF